MDLLFGVLLGFLAGVMSVANASVRLCVGCKRLLDGNCPECRHGRA